tara:strand:+ start:5642 stop:6910 length:1269 start_codon:yes stop_codon:yes gene_type:complete
MKIRQAFRSRSLKDFSSLFFANIIQKFFGLFREIITASIFGSSILYANFLLLQSVSGLFSQFTIGNALKANLLPKFTKIFSEHKVVSFRKILSFSKKSMLLLFVVSQIIQFFIILYLDSDYSKYLLIISVFLSVTVCFNFYNNIYLTLLQAKGKFRSYSFATTLNEFSVAVFIYPLSVLIDVTGLVVSRIIGVLSITFAYVLPMNKQNEGYEIELKRKDFNIPTLILGNFANIILLSSRFISGADGGINITYFTYSIFILNVLLTTVVGNISTLLLRKVSIKKNTNFMLYSLVISFLMGIGLILGLEYFGFRLIQLIFMRGEFNLVDVEKTTIFIKQLSYSFILIFMSTTLFQPFFSLDIKKSRIVRKRISLIFISTIIFGFLLSWFLNFDVKYESLIMMYFSSFISVILSLYSYIYYLNNN